jgi:hypothetical protein
VIKEDPKNENILYLGTDNGAYVSFNMGTSWEVFSKGLPNVAIHDIVVQPEANDLLLGTHGRSIYKTNIDALQQMNADLKAKSTTIFDVGSVRHSGRWGSAWSQWSDAYEPSKTIQFYSNTSDEKTMKILSENGAELNSFKLKVDKGFNYTDYDLTLSEKGKKALEKANKELKIGKSGNGKYYLPKGVYTIEIGDAKSTLEIK